MTSCILNRTRYIFYLSTRHLLDTLSYTFTKPATKAYLISRAHMYFLFMSVDVPSTSREQYDILQANLDKKYTFF